MQSQLTLILVLVFALLLALLLIGPIIDHMVYVQYMPAANNHNITLHKTKIKKFHKIRTVKSTYTCPTIDE